MIFYFCSLLKGSFFFKSLCFTWCKLYDKKVPYGFELHANFFIVVSFNYHVSHYFLLLFARLFFSQDKIKMLSLIVIFFPILSICIGAHLLTFSYEYYYSTLRIFLPLLLCSVTCLFDLPKQTSL